MCGTRNQQNAAKKKLQDSAIMVLWRAAISLVAPYVLHLQ